MKTALRMFALAIAVTGLASAAFSPAATQTQSKQASILAVSPAAAAMPGPSPCGAFGCPGIAGSTNAPVR